MGNKESNPRLSEVQKNFALFDAKRQTNLIEEVAGEYQEKTHEAGVGLTSSFLEYSSVLSKNLSDSEKTILLKYPKIEKSLFSRKEKMVPPFTWGFYYLGLDAHLSINSRRADNPIYQSLLAEEPEDLPVSVLALSNKMSDQREKGYPLTINLKDEDLEIRLAKIVPGRTHLDLDLMDKVLEKAKESANTGVLTTYEEASWVSERSAYLAQLNDLKENTNPDLKAKLHNAAIAIDKLITAEVLNGKHIQSVEYKDKLYGLDLRTGSIIKLGKIDPKTTDYTKVAPLFAEKFQKLLRGEED